MKKHMFIKSIAAVVTVIGIITSSTIQVKQVNADTMNQYIDRVCQIALNEVDYIEKKSKKDLDKKEANAGTANYTKYAQTFDDLRKSGKMFYNFEKNNLVKKKNEKKAVACASWCDIFVDWCFYSAYGYNLAQKLLYQPEKSSGAGCSASAGYFNKNGKLYTSKTGTPQKGDQVFLNGGGHTGLIVDVVKVKNKYEYTVVEGNAGDNCDRVVTNTYTGTGSFSSWGRPNYSLVTSYFNYAQRLYIAVTGANCSTAKQKEYADRLAADKIDTTIVSLGWELINTNAINRLTNEAYVNKLYYVFIDDPITENEKKHLLDVIKYKDRKAAYEEVVKSSKCRAKLKKQGLTI